MEGVYKSPGVKRSEAIKIGLQNRYERRKRKVIQIDIVTNKTIGVYQSIDEAAEKTEIHKSCIKDAVSGKQKTAGGYRWETLKVAS